MLKLLSAIIFLGGCATSSQLFIAATDARYICYDVEITSCGINAKCGEEDLVCAKEITYIGPGDHFEPNIFDE